MKTETSKLDLNAASLKRWRTRLKRAMTMIDKLEKQRKRLEAADVKRQVAPSRAMAQDVAPEPVKRKPAETSENPVSAKPDDLDIPSFLRREPDPVAEQIKAEQAEIKRAKARGRIEKMKAKKRGDLKKMPLTGKAALEAIRNA